MYIVTSITEKPGTISTFAELYFSGGFQQKRVDSFNQSQPYVRAAYENNQVKYGMGKRIPVPYSELPEYAKYYLLKVLIDFLPNIKVNVKTLDTEGQELFRHFSQRLSANIDFKKQWHMLTDLIDVDRVNNAPIFLFERKGFSFVKLTAHRGENISETACWFNADTNYYVMPTILNKFDILRRDSAAQCLDLNLTEQGTRIHRMLADGSIRVDGGTISIPPGLIQGNPFRIFNDDE